MEGLKQDLHVEEMVIAPLKTTPASATQNEV